MAKARTKGEATKGEATKAKRGATGATTVVVTAASVDQEAAALRAEDVRRVPAWVTQRLGWFREIQRAGRAHAVELAKVPMPPEPRLTAAEIDALDAKIQRLEVLVAALRAARSTPPAEDEELARLRGEIRGLQRVLLAGLAHIYRDDRAKRRRITEIRRGDGDADLLQDSRDILELCAQVGAALAELTHDEAAKAERLAEATARFRALVGSPAASASASSAPDLGDLRRRVYTLAARGVARIRAAARYQFPAGDPRRAAFPAFRPPRRSKGA